MRMRGEKLVEEKRKEAEAKMEGRKLAPSFSHDFKELQTDFEP